MKDPPGDDKGASKHSETVFFFLKDLKKTLKKRIECCSSRKWGCMLDVKLSMDTYRHPKEVSPPTFF